MASVIREHDNISDGGDSPAGLYSIGQRNKNIGISARQRCLEQLKAVVTRQAGALIKSN